jgi:hypothetical protein
MFNHLANLNAAQITLDTTMLLGVYEEDTAESRVYSAFVNVMNKSFSLMESEYKLLKNVFCVRGAASRTSFEDVKENFNAQARAIKFLLYVIVSDLNELGNKYLVNPHP